MILQRLVNPYLPPQTNLAQPNYNPYITVDFLENIPTRDRAMYDDTDKRGNFAKSDGASIGRKHPYSNMPAFDPTMADANAVVQQTRPVADNVNPPHSFFSTNYTSAAVNAGGNAAFIHYDRELLNSTELLFVSIHSPSLLTGKFGNAALQYQQHIGNDTTLPGAFSALLNTGYPSGAGTGSQLFKAFDLLATGNRMQCVPLGGREPGRLNVNTMSLPASDTRLMQALLDPQENNTFFGSSVVGDAWTTVVQTRTPGWPAFDATPDEKTGGTNRPFKLSAGAATSDDTLFRQSSGTPGTPMLFNGGAPRTPTSRGSRTARRGTTSPPSATASS